MSGSHHIPRHNPCEIGELAEFDRDLGDIPEDEKRRKRILYLRQALAQMETGLGMQKSMGCLFIPFAIIPIFWPFIIFAWVMARKTRRMAEEMLLSACDYWELERDDLR